jgi:hypothetical protein
MANALTGDFEAVLQVSGGTLRRLVASMHQNASGDTATPNLPHIAYFRLGEDGAVAGEHGAVAAQIGVPQIELIHGATDRFRLAVGVRARYTADPGTIPLADFIHGTVRAEYRFQDIDPNCWGWRGIADEYLWIRVVKDTIAFEGAVLNESGLLELAALLDEPRVKAHIAMHLAGLLTTHFAPAPQQVGKRFRRMRSLSFGDGPAQSAIVFPFGLTTETPAGNLASVHDILLDGHDFALAVSSDFIMSKIGPMLDPIGGVQRDFRITGDAGFLGGLSIDYHLRTDPASAEWLGPFALPFVTPSGGLIRIRITASGRATRLYRSGVYNIGSLSLSDLAASASVDQLLVLTFDAAAERFSVAALGAPAVTVNYNGPYAGELKAEAKNRITSEVQANLGGALQQAQNALNALAAPSAKAVLIEQLRRLDPAAAARFDGAAFHPDGVILRGAVSVAYRHRPEVRFEKTPAGDGFDAIESWIPGGRVDRFEWTWRWFTNPIEKPPGPPGAISAEDSFVLRRPHAARSKFGLMLGLDQPLPGLDGIGRMCLTISGVHVDHVTGALVPVTSVRECEQYGFEFKLPYEVGPYVRICDPLRAREREAPEIGILRVGVRNAAAAQAGSNTLVVYLREAWNEQAAATLRAGLERCRREGAGLLVLVLFQDGVLRRGGGEPLQASLGELAAGLPAPVVVNEDVYEGWSKALSISAARGEPAWRLVSPSGLVTWAHDGGVEPELLASALERRLEPSRPPGLVRFRPDVSIGAKIPIEIVVPPCPPAPLGRLGIVGSKLVFVQKGASSTLTQLSRLAREQQQHAAQTDENPFVAVVVEGANAREAEALRAETGADFPMLPDPDGAVTRRAGVRLSPTVMTLDPFGRLAGVDMGVDPGERHGSRTGEAE